jgi:hypothetical protein
LGWQGKPWLKTGESSARHEEALSPAADALCSRAQAATHEAALKACHMSLRGTKANQEEGKEGKTHTHKHTHKGESRGRAGKVVEDRHRMSASCAYCPPTLPAARRS